MGWTQRLTTTLRAALLTVSAWATFGSPSSGVDLATLERARRRNGGQLGPPPETRTRWYQADLETAEYLADAGDLTMAGQLCRAMDRDAHLSGLMSTRAGGMVRLPKRFRGPRDMVEALQQGGEQARSVFDEMLPASELERFVADGVKLGVAIGELVPVEGRDYAVFVRRSPENLVYRWSENRWYFRSLAGLIEITPGDGQWVLHTPGGREAPWQGGSWRGLSRAYVTKDHARLHRDNWENNLAHPARVATHPQGAGEKQKDSFFKRVLAWGKNTVFGLPPGYDVKLLESNGRGHESWRDTIAEQNAEMTIAVAGQTVTTDGGTGFANADIHKSIRADLIKRDADALAHTINTQILPAWVLNVFGAARLVECPTVEWDVEPAKDQAAAANAMNSAALAVKALTEAFAPYGMRPDVVAIAVKFGIPVQATPAEAANERPPLTLVRTEEAA